MPSKERYSELLFGAAPYVDVDDEMEGAWQVSVVKLYFRKYELDQCRYWYVILHPDLPFMPDVRQDSIPIAKRHGDDWSHLDGCDHVADWFFVRTMSANEINNYFH